MNKNKRYWQELQRRHVFKAGIAYLLGAWLIVQILSILFPAFEASPENLRTAIIILGIGFPIWLIIAWVFDFSSEGIRKTEDLPYDPQKYKKKNASLNRFIIGGLAIAVILLLVQVFSMSGDMEELREDFLAINYKSSIAVMALEDLSPEKGNDHLSKGISQSISDRLIRFKDLKVTPSTSAFYYNNKGMSIDVIARELEVAYILEGSIFPKGENYRISVRLIDSNDNSAIWTKTYNDKKENILETYDDLAENIAHYLKLTVDTKDIQAKKVDPEAYDLYLRSFTIRHGLNNEEGERKTDSLLQRALKIDSTYAPIHAGYAGTLFRQTVYLDMIDREEGLRRAMRSSKKAYALDPENVLALNWCSNVSWHLRDFDGYHRYLNELIDLNIMNADVASYLSWHYKRTNQVDKGYPYIKKAVELDPRNIDHITQLIEYESYYENFDEVLELTERIGEIKPALYEEKLFEYYYYSRKFTEAMQILKKVINDPDELFMMEVYFEGLKGNLEMFEANFEVHRDYYGDDLESFYFDTGYIYGINGDLDKGFKYLDSMEFDYYLNRPDALFIDSDAKSLHSDPRWDTFVDRLAKELNYDFKNQD